MAVKDTPVYAQKIRTVQIVTTAAKTTFGDVANAVKIATVGADGGFLRKLKVRPRANVTATHLMVFVTKAADGSDVAPFLVDSLLGWSGGATVSATSASPAADFGYTGADPRKLEAGDKIWVGMGVALAAGVVWEGELEEFS